MKPAAPHVTSREPHSAAGVVDINAVVSPNLPPELEQQPPVGLIAIWMTTEFLALIGLIALGLSSARVFANWIPWAFFGSALFVALSGAPIPGLQFAGAIHVVLLYSGLVGMAVSLIRPRPRAGSAAGQRVLAAA